MSTSLGESFVIWLDDDLADGELRGTIEVVRYGRRTRFEDEQSLGRILRAGSGWRGNSVVSRKTRPLRSRNGEPHSR